MLEKILEYIYPPTCGVCGKICKDYICNKCTIKLRKYEIKNNYVSIIKKEEKYFDELFYIFKYEDIIRDILIKYKFQNKPYLYKTFAKIILKNEKACGFLKKYDIIIPVPIHKKRKLIRGYNQTELIAKSIAKQTKLELETDILFKQKNIVSQSGLNKTSRKENIKNAFMLKKTNKLKNKSILLFDDIYTTGSTANECAKILKEADVKKVGVLTISKDLIKQKNMT